MKTANRTPKYTMRRYTVLVIFTMAVLGLVYRALDMQVLNQAFFQKQGDARHLRVVEVPAHRGDIVDRNGEPLAISTPVDTVWANPSELIVDKTRLPALATLLSMDAARLSQRLQHNAHREFMYIRRHVSPSLGEKVMALGLSGVYLRRDYKRYYPTGEVSAHLLGFTNVDDMGQEGLELAYNDYLTGVSGSKRIIRDRLGRAVDDIERLKPAEPGRLVQLSLDRRLQYMAYRALKAAVKEHHAIAGSAVLLDAHNGEVLAMVNQPSFNPNDRSQLKPGVYRNRAVVDVFEPGSTMKPFTMAAALETGRWHPQDNVHTEPGYYQVQGHEIKDMHNYGKLSLGGIIVKSSNVGISKVALSMEPEQQLGMYNKLGFGTDTGSGFPGERGGNMRLGHVSEFERATMAFGYSMSVTNLQLARAYGALAADGVLHPVTYLKRDEKSIGVRVMAAKTARQVRKMMEQVVSRKGTAVKAKIANYRIAGKTGTVHKFIAGGYAHDRYLAIFAGIAPATHPRLVMVVMLDEPRRGGHFGGQVAAPVFAKVMSSALRLMNIPPDNLQLANQSNKGRGA